MKKSMRVLSFLVASLILLGFSAVAPAHADSLTINIGSLYEGANTGQVWNETGYLGRWADSVYVLANTYGPFFGWENGGIWDIGAYSHYRTAMMVDLSPLADATITSAHLEFFNAGGSSMPVTVSFFESADGSLGWFWDAPGTVFQQGNYTSVGSGNNSFNVTGAVQDRVSNDALWLGMLFAGTDYGFNLTDLHAYDPNVRLVVEYQQPVPEPLSATVLGLGLGVLSLRRFVRSRR